MRVALTGYGRMGKEVEAILLQRNHTISARIDPAGGSGILENLTPEALSGADVAIEFSLPSGVAENAAVYGKAGVPVVLGTTGWESSRNVVEKSVEKSGIGMVYGSNFSIGAHLFFAIAEKAAALINGIAEYDVMMYELHHKMKKDSPSGTALAAARRIMKACPRKTVIQTEKLDRQIRPEELHVASIRGGSVPGTHTVLLDSAADSIEISHIVRNRSGLALGAVLAAEWILGKKGFFSVDDFIRDFLADKI